MYIYDVYCYLPGMLYLGTTIYRLTPPPSYFLRGALMYGRVLWLLSYLHAYIHTWHNIELLQL